MSTDPQTKDDWRRGYDTGYAADGMVVSFQSPPGADSSKWISGFFAGRRGRQDADLTTEIEKGVAHGE